MGRSEGTGKVEDGDIRECRCGYTGRLRRCRCGFLCSEEPPTPGGSLLKKVLLLAPLALSLASCNLKMPASAAGLNPVRVLLDTGLQPQGRVVYLRLTDRFAIPGNTVALRGTLNPLLPGQGNPDPTLQVTGEVYASVSRPACLPQVSGAGTTCDQPEGEKVGRYSIKSGLGELEAEGARLTQGLNAGELWLGLRVTRGSLPAGTTLTYNGLILPP